MYLFKPCWYTIQSKEESLFENLYLLAFHTEKGSAKTHFSEYKLWELTQYAWQQTNIKYMLNLGNANFRSSFLSKKLLVEKWERNRKHKQKIHKTKLRLHFQGFKKNYFVILGKEQERTQEVMMLKRLTLIMVSRSYNPETWNFPFY